MEVADGNTVTAAERDCRAHDSSMARRDGCSLHLGESLLLVAADDHHRRYTEDPETDSAAAPLSDCSSNDGGGADRDNNRKKAVALDVALMAPAPRVVAATVCVMLPYLASKLCIAAYTAYQEVLFGRLGGAALEAEADAYHVLFLLLGTAMGGLRTTSILIAFDWYAAPMALVAHLQLQPPRPQPAAVPEDVQGTTIEGATAALLASRDALVLHEGTTTTRCGCLRTVCKALVFLVRGAPLSIEAQVGHPREAAPNDGVDALSAHRRPPHEQQPSLRAVAMVPLVSSCATVLYASCAAAGMWFGHRLVPCIATDTNANIVAAVAAFGRGFWWGVWPTLLLYNKEQLLLATGRSVLPLVYGGLVYCGVGAFLAAAWYHPRSHADGDANTPPLFAGVEGIARSLSASAWVAYAALKLHLWCDPWTRRAAIPLNTEAILWDWLFAPSPSSDRSAASSSLRGRVVDLIRNAAPHAVRYVGLAVPLAISNGLGLMRQLVVAAVTSQCSSTAATAFSVSASYYSTAEIVLLAASSTISAMVAADAKRCLRPAVITVLVFGVLLGLPPLLAPAAIARVFGGSVYAFGQDVVDSVLEEVRYFNILTFCSFYLTVIGMAVAAMLHGMQHVWTPMLLQLVANTVGAGWAIGFGGVSGAASCAWGVGGSVVANALTVVGLLILRRSYMRKTDRL